MSYITCLACDRPSHATVTSPHTRRHIGDGPYWMALADWVQSVHDSWVITLWPWNFYADCGWMHAYYSRIMYLYCCANQIWPRTLSTALPCIQAQPFLARKKSTGSSRFWPLPFEKLYPAFILSYKKSQIIATRQHCKWLRIKLRKRYYCASQLPPCYYHPLATTSVTVNVNVAATVGVSSTTLA